MGRPSLCISPGPRTVVVWSTLLSGVRVLRLGVYTCLCTALKWHVMSTVLESERNLCVTPTALFCCQVVLLSLLSRNHSCTLSTRIVPCRFQAGGRRRRPNLGLVCVLFCNLCYLYSLVKMDCGVLFYLV